MAIETQLLLGLMNGIVYGLVVALIALGLSLIFGLMGVVNVAHGELFMLGGIVTWYVVNYLGGYYIALLAAPILIGGLGIGIERIVLRPLGYKPENTIIATIGVLFIIQHSTLLIFGPAPRNVLAPFDFVVQMPGFGYSGYRIIVSAISVVLLVTVWTLVHKTRFGLYVRACQQNQEVATTLGIPVNRVFMLAFGLSSALAALGAAISAPLLSVHYLAGLDILIISFIVVIVGGLGSLKGTVLAAILICTMEGVASAFVAPTEARILSLILLVAVLVVRPSGLFGRGGPR
jgi:branched-chain amino acid transport system permease protein